MDYWQRLQPLDMYSLESRREKYMAVYVWKMINGMVLNLEENNQIRHTAVEEENCVQGYGELDYTNS